MMMIWQTAALDDERNDIDIMRRRMEASVILIEGRRRRMEHGATTPPLSAAREPMKLNEKGLPANVGETPTGCIEVRGLPHLSTNTSSLDLTIGQ